MISGNLVPAVFNGGVIFVGPAADGAAGSVWTTDGNGQIVISTALQDQIDELTSAYARRKMVLARVDNTQAPPSENSGDRYLLDDTGGGVHADWDGAAANDIVEFEGDTWIATSPSEGWIVYNDDDNLDWLYVDDGSPEWQARPAIITDHGTLSGLTDDDHTQYALSNGQRWTTTPTASRAVISNGDGHLVVSSVTSTELGYLSSVTSDIQTQLDAKAFIASSNTFTATQHLGDGSGNVTLNINAGSANVGEIVIRTASSPRWTIRKNGTAETGGNVGSDFLIQSRADDGSALTTIMQIARSTGNITFGNAVDFAFATSTGTKLGTAVSQKLAFWGATPIVQPAHADQAALSFTPAYTGSDLVSQSAIESDMAAVKALVNKLRESLVNLGLIKGSA